MRAGKQCRERWHNHLRPDIKRGPWTEEEERLLIAAHESLGNRWAEIAKVLPQRKELQSKNRWFSALRRELRKLTRLAGKQQDTLATMALTAATAAFRRRGGSSSRTSSRRTAGRLALSPPRVLSLSPPRDPRRQIQPVVRQRSRRQRLKRPRPPLLRPRARRRPTSTCSTP